MTSSMKRVIAVVLPLFFLTVTATAKERTIVKFGKDIIVHESMKVESVVAIAGDLTIYGEVDEDAVCILGDIYLGSNAVVRGDAVAVGGEMEMEPGAVIYGEIVEVDIFNIASFRKPFHRHEYWGIPWFLKIISLVGLLALALIIAVLAPNQIETITRSIETDILRAALFGIIGSILFVPLIIMLAVSILGIPLIPLAVISIILLVLFGYISLAALLGKRILTALSNTSQSLLLPIVVGLIAFWAVGLIPIMGWFIKGVVYLVGFGAVLATIVDRRKVNKVMPPEEKKELTD